MAYDLVLDLNRERRNVGLDTRIGVRPYQTLDDVELAEPDPYVRKRWCN